MQRRTGRKLETAEQPGLQWYSLAHQILLACRPLSERVIDESPKLMLTDADWSVLEGFQIVLNRSNETELLALSVAAGLSRRNFDAMLDLYNFKRRN